MVSSKIMKLWQKPLVLVLTLAMMLSSVSMVAQPRQVLAAAAAPLQGVTILPDTTEGSYTVSFPGSGDIKFKATPSGAAPIAPEAGDSAIAYATTPPAGLQIGGYLEAVRVDGADNIVEYILIPITDAHISMQMRVGDVPREMTPDSLPVQVAPHFSVSGGAPYADGKLNFTVVGNVDLDPIADPANRALLLQTKSVSKASEILTLPATAHTTPTAIGEIAVVGDKIYLGVDRNGQLVSKQIGYVHADKNGNGKELEVVFSSPLPNGDFSNGTDGWTINNNRVILGSLASKTQGRQLVSTSLGGNLFEVSLDPTEVDANNPFYSYVTATNYGGQFYEAKERGVKAGAKYSTRVVSGELQLTMSGTVTANIKGDPTYGSTFGPEATSSVFEATPGDIIAFNWRAQGGADDYEIYGFLQELDDNGQVVAIHDLMYGRGKTQALTKASSEVPAFTGMNTSGKYRFHFVAGSYDRSGGLALGATLYISDIRVLNQLVTSDVVEAIAKMVTYENTPFPRPLNDADKKRVVRVTLSNGQADPDTQIGVDIATFNLNIPEGSGAPGGVSGTALWIKADEGVSKNTDDQVMAWKDHSGMSDQLQKVGNSGEVQWQKSGANYYPVVQFGGGYLTGSKSFATSEAYAVAKHNAAVSGEQAIAGPSGTATVSGLFSAANNRVRSQIITNSGTVARTIESTPRIDNKLDLFGLSAPAGRGYWNGRITNRVSAYPNNIGSATINVGARSDAAARMSGQVAELIIYDKVLTTTERLQVNSYLAMKYGLTLMNDAGNATDYITSVYGDAGIDASSQHMWTASKNSGFGYRITGVGRDDQGSLHQKQSKSQENGALVALGLGSSIEESVQQNSQSIAHNLTFFTFSDNNKSSTFTKLFSTTTVGDNLKHMDRSFKIDKSLNWQDRELTFQLDESVLTDSNQYPLQAYLVVGSDAGFRDTPQAFIPLHAANDVSSGAVRGAATLHSVTFGDGDYFTFAVVNKDHLHNAVAEANKLEPQGYAPRSWDAFQKALQHAQNVLNNPAATQAEIDAALTALELAKQALVSGDVVTPGGVGGAALWLRADGVDNGDGTLSHQAKATSGGQLSGWEDVTYKNKFVLEADNAALTLSAGHANFNPAVMFDGGRLIGDYAFASRDAFAVATLPASGAWTVAAPQETPHWSSLFRGNASNLVSQFVNQEGLVKSSPLHPVSTTDGYNMLAVSAERGRAWTSGVAGTGTVGFKEVGAHKIYVGSRSDGGVRYGGALPELIIYDRTLTSAERQQVNSYLAMKYGFTLRSDGGGFTNYLSSTGSILWRLSSNSGYGHRFTAIVRDDASALNQTQSKSREIGGNLTIALGQTIESTLADNANHIGNNRSLFAFSDNNKSTAYNQSVTANVYEDYNQNMKRMDRIYKVAKSDWVDGLATFELDQVDPQALTVMMISSYADMRYPTYAILQNGKVTLNTAELGDTVYFTFAKTYRDALQTKVTAFAGLLSDTKYTQASRDALAEDLQTAQAVLNNPNAHQIQIDNALADLEDAAKYLVLEPSRTVELPIAIEEVGGLPQGTYSLKSWNAAQTAKNVAEAVYSNQHSDPSVTPGGALANLELAKAGLVDLSALIAEKDLSAAIDPSAVPGPYTMNTWTPFEEELATAQALLNRALTDPGFEVSQAEIDAATATLKQAREALHQPSKEMLQVAVAQTNPLVADSYTPESWAVLQQALDEAHAVLGKSGATEDEIAAATNKIKEAQAALQPVDKQPLQQARDQVKGEDLQPQFYTPESWNNLQQKLAAAEAILAKPLPTQTELNEAKAQLEAARQALKPLDKEPLRQAIKKVDDEALQSGAFTTDSWQAFEEKLTAARNVLNKALPTQDELDKAKAELEAARAALVAAPYTGDGGFGGWTPPHTANKETRTIDFVVEGADPQTTLKLEVERITEADGTKKDRVELTRDKAREAVELAKETGSQTARIVIPDDHDDSSEIKVDLPRAAARVLQQNGIDLGIDSRHAKVLIPQSSLEGVTEDLYFRIQPIRDNQAQDAAKDQAIQAAVTMAWANGDPLSTFGRPVKIETNLDNRPLSFTLPLNQRELPTDEAARAKWLEELAIHVSHDDGSEALIIPEIVVDDRGVIGLKFDLEQAGDGVVFTIVRAERAEYVHQQYINGYEDGMFRPNQGTTRAEMAAMLVKIGGAKPGEHAAAFADVTESHWATRAISGAVDAGLMKGYLDKTFKPSGQVTRAELTVIVFNYLGLSAKSSVSFSDVPADHWANGFIEAVREAGYVTGYEDGTFKPSQAVTRAEAVTILNRVFDRGPLFDAPASIWPDVDHEHWAYQDIVEASMTHRFEVLDLDHGSETWKAAE